MRWNLWLAQPETERALKSVLRIAMTLTALWTLTAAYGVWSTRTALAATQVSSLAQSSQLAQLALSLPAKRCLALKASEVKMLSSQGSGSAEITEEFADLARMAGAEVRGVQIGDGKQGSAVAQPPPSRAGTETAGTSPAAAPTAGTGSADQEAFECNIAGDYPSLTRFLGGLAASHHILDITSLEVTQNGAKSGSDPLRLEMKINGIVHEALE